MPTRTHPSRCAFTIVEVLTVVIILAILAALAVPMLGDTDDVKLRAAAQLVASDLGYAQVDSISHSDDPRLVVFNSTTANYRIAPNSAPTTPITNPVGKAPYTTTFGQGRASNLTGVTIDSYSLGGDDRIRFGIFGQLDQTTAATVTLRSGPKRITVSIDAVTGETSMSAIF